MNKLLRVSWTVGVMIAVGSIAHSFIARDGGALFGQIAQLTPGNGEMESFSAGTAAPGQEIFAATRGNSPDPFGAAVRRAVLAAEADPPAFQELLRDRSSWPHVVRLERMVEVAVYDEGRRVGTVGFPAGRELSVERIQADGTIVLASRTARFEVDYAQTNLLAQAKLDRQAQLAWLRMIDQRRTLLARERGEVASPEGQLASASERPSPSQTGDLAANSPEAETLIPRELLDRWQEYIDLL